MIKKENDHNRTRERERERKKRGNRKYGQAKLKHAKRGIVSCVCAGFAGVILSSMLISAYLSRGGAKPIVGLLGIMTMILAAVGIYFAVKGFKEREKDYLTCKIGIGCNLFLFLSFLAIFCRGLF